jgi:hypothetical protein
MSVSFGGIAATTFAGEGCGSSTQCIVFSPPAAIAGMVDVVASIGGATSANAPPNPQFSYTGPNITGFSPRSGPISGGTPVEITGSGFPAYDGIHPLNMQVSFGDVQTMAECFVTDCDVASPQAMHPGPVHITATAFGVSSTSADVFTYSQYPALTKLLLPGGPNSGSGSVYLDGNAPADGAMINFTSSDQSAVLLRPVTIPPGSYWMTVPVTFLPTSRTETVTVTATRR